MGFNYIFYMVNQYALSGALQPKRTGILLNKRSQVKLSNKISKPSPQKIESVKMQQHSQSTPKFGNKSTNVKNMFTTLGRK